MHAFGLSLEKELEFTTRIIRSNFSNRSAWHYRSVILKAIYESKDGTLLVETMDADFGLIHNAIWTSPSDETPWRHYRWLIDHYAEYKHHKVPRFVTNLSIDTHHILLTTEHLQTPELCKILVDGQECKCETVDSSNATAIVFWFERPEHLKVESTILITCDQRSTHLEVKSELAFNQCKRDVLDRELASINELLEEEPNATHAHVLAAYIQSTLGMTEEARRSRQHLESIDILRSGMWRESDSNVPLSTFRECVCDVPARPQLG